jgi:cytochrome c oxidase subunit 2
MLPKYFPLFPDQASTLAPQVDYLFFFILGVTLFFLVLVTALIVVFAVHYRRERHPVPHQIEGSVPLEIFWSAVPLGIAMVIFAWSATLFIQERRPPAGSLDVYAIGKQWMWKFQHPGGQREINTLHLPTGRPVRVTMISMDVIHALYVPAFRTQYNVTPGRYTTMWFEATKPGTYHLFCAQYCGTNHSAMAGQVVVMEPGDYEQWLKGAGAWGSMATEGQKIFLRSGCHTCHRGSNDSRGPNLAALYGTAVRLQDGNYVKADEEYIRDSVLNPSNKIVAGFQNIMPTFQGQINEDEMIALVEYIKSVQTTEQLEMNVTNTQSEPPVNKVKIQQGVDVTKPGNNTTPVPLSETSTPESGPQKSQPKPAAPGTPKK